ncbi:hypothetical protein SAMN04487775_10176 [Treponema bryantii]|uniref:Lipoprotein n=1 Tax=Treponema bryantii TaxID=163 RepID=A0A1I3HTW5_9SPIR|nr:DUF3261 domain-containing protein [Treponema bryantii]SFI39165.1 hypothetical protein SAMN04487775_10176 [Treponema bryantii]
MIKKMPAVVESVETTIKRSLCFLCILVISLFMISCKSTEVSKSSKKITAKGLRPIYVTNTKKVELLLPEYALGTYDGIQLLEGTFGDTSFTLLSYTQIDATGISLSLMNDFGSDMGNVFYDGNNVVFDSAYFPKALPGEYIICDIQNAFYDKEYLRMNYESVGLSFEVWNGTGYNPTTNVIETRLIRDGKKLIEEITILENTVTIKNHLRGYEYKLTKIEE